MMTDPQATPETPPTEATQADPAAAPAAVDAAPVAAEQAPEPAPVDASPEPAPEDAAGAAAEPDPSASAVDTSATAGATVGMSIPADSSATATVTPAAEQPQPNPDVDPESWTTLYDAAGEEIRVKEKSVVTFLQRGFERAPLDPHALAQEIQVLAPSVGEAVAALERETAEKGAIDAVENGAHHVAEQAVATLVDTWNRFQRGLWARYKLAQPTEDAAASEPQPAAEGQVNA